MSRVQSSNDLDVDLRQLFGSLGRDWKRIALVALLVTGIALVLAWLATPHYMGETRILIETRESIFTRPDVNGESERPILDEEGVTSQVEVITSTDLLKEVALKLNLAKLPEFDEAADMSLLDRLLVIATLKSDPSEIPPEERVLKAFRDKLNVYRVEKSRVIVIEMSSEDPKLAAAIPNALAQAYIATQGLAKLESNSDATAWLEPEIANLSKRVKDAEGRVASFRAASDLLIGDNNSVLATQQLSELSTELSRVRANRAAAEATAQGVRGVLQGGGSLEALPEILSSALIQRLREKQVQLNADIAELSTTLLGNHPRIRALKSQLSDLDQQIRREAENVLKGLQTEAKTAQAREAQLVADLNRLKAESARAGGEEVELRALEREANAQRELLESYLARYREAASRKEGNYLPADARIFSRATVPSEPYFPKVLPIAGAAFAASLLLMALATLLQELFSGRAMRAAPFSDLEPAERAVLPPVPEEVLIAAPAAAGIIAAEVPAQSGGPTLEAAAEPIPAAAPRLETQPALAPKDDDAPANTPLAPPATESAAPARRQPFVLEPVRTESFREAWARRKALEEEIRRELAEREPVGRQTAYDQLDGRTAAANDGPGGRPLPGAFGEIGIAKAAEKLIAGGATRAIFVSPEGDEAAAAAVLVAREVADAGLRVLLLDLTASGAAGRPMLESIALPGITNLLASEAQFTDVIHQDHFSDCHVMPVGTANAARAMRAADRLPIIMESLTTAYDVVVVECGPADAEGIRRLVSADVEVLLSVLEPDESILGAAAELAAGGYGAVTLVTPAGYERPNTPLPGRSAA